MQYKLDVLNKLEDINEDKDIRGLSHAIFPGTHCPLFGVALTASYIENMVMLVVGTSECTYYTKIFAMHRQEGNDKVYSLVLKDKEVVFGAENQVKEAIKYIADNHKPSGIMIVTTCVPELIGEDYKGIEMELEEEINLPIFVVNTEHYKCNSHIPGMKRAIQSLVKLMKKQHNLCGVNILGHREKGVDNTELVRILNKNNIQVNMIVPSKCTIEELECAPSAKVNIVTDMIALDLAKSMEKKFGTPYILFDKHMNLNEIRENYNELSEIFNIDFNGQLKEEMDNYNKLFLETKYLLKEKRFIYGNTPMMAFETAEFLCELGLKPELIQVRELYDEDIKWKESISNMGYNPYVTRIANIAPLRALYDSMNVQLYIGHENPILLKEKGITQLTLDSHAQKIGYELPIGIMNTLIEKFKRS